jgi:Zn-dependent protease with chaperone function
MLIATINVLLVPSIVLIFPIALTLWFRHAASHAAEPGTTWGVYRGLTRFILAITVTGWWVIWDLRSRSDLISIIDHRWPGMIETSFSEILLFCALPTVSLGIFLFLCNRVDKTILKLKWTIAQTLWQTCWGLVGFVVPLLMVARGFDAILDGKFSGIVWLLVAGVLSRIGTGFLRLAQGMKFNTLKSGELRNQARSMARRMGVTLGTVYIVPAGKGHLTNAYGMSNAIALTDNLGKYLTKTQLEFVIGHELAHVRLKHGRKDLLLVIAIFSAVSLLLFSLSQKASLSRPLIQIVAIIGPLVALNYYSRHLEYSADGEAVDFTGDAETAIRALANLQRISELPAASDRFTELLMTHPTLAHRVRAIADRGHIPTKRLTDLLKEAGTPISIRPEPTEQSKIS